MITVQLQRLASVRGLYFGSRGTLITGDQCASRGTIWTETTSHYGDAFAGSIDDSPTTETIDARDE